MKTLLSAVKLVTVAVMLASVCHAEFCDGGPPGKYCFDDLTGYHDCVLDNSTGKFVDHMVHCTGDTRCTCMGLPCTTDTPCGPYKRAPAVFTGDYTTECVRVYINCHPPTCTTSYGLFAFWQDLTNKKYRSDVSTMETRRGLQYQYSIILPNDQSSFDVYNIEPVEKSCSKSTMPSYPPQLIDLSIFTFNGTETINGVVCERWIWMYGGRREDEPINTMLFYITMGKPFQYRGTFPRSQKYGGGSEIQIFFGEYVVGTPDPEVFDLPSYCETRPVEQNSKISQNFNAMFFADVH